jgi:hypothetical protein
MHQRQQSLRKMGILGRKKRVRRLICRETTVIGMADTSHPTAPTPRVPPCHARPYMRQKHMRQKRAEASPVEHASPFIEKILHVFFKKLLAK